MRSMLRKLSISGFALILCVSALCVSSPAQDLDKVTISGTVTDSNNAPIAGATVTATLTTTAAPRTVTTNEDGIYKIVQLEPGNYTVKFSATGFGAKEQKEFSAIAAQNLQFNIQLAPAGVTAEQTIIIDDDSALAVDTTRTIVGGTITQREIEELPNVSRNPLDLVLTLGGTSEEALSTRDLAEDRNANNRLPPTEQGNFSLSGGASYSNNITIDGLDNNDDLAARDRFQPSLEAIAEVQVITNQFSSEYGRASGGRINLRTRSGTKRFRGRAFMFFRDDNLNANTYYNNSRGLARLPLTEYNPGFTFSGPVILPFGEGRSLYDGRKKTFFLVAYEYTNLKDTTLIDAYVPVGVNPRFALPNSTGGAPTCDNAATSACAGNAPTAAFVSPYTLTLPTPSLNHSLTARLDHKLFKNNDLTFGLQIGRRNNQRQPGASVTKIVDSIQARRAATNAYNFTDNYVISANIVNQFRAQWSSYQPSFETNNPLDPVVLIAYRDPVLSSSRTLVAGNSTTSLSQSGIFSDRRRETRLQLQDSLTYLIGSHTLKTGFDIQNVNSKVTGLEDATGTFNFGSVLNFQNNVLSRYRQNFGTSADVKNTYYGIFVNDETRLRPNLTLSYGVRYERETAISDNNNFGPRLGIAYAPWKSGRGVIRFGTGIFYNRALLRTIGNFVQNTGGGLVIFDTNTIGTSTSDARRINILAKIAQQFPNSFASATEIKNLVAGINCGTTAAPAACAPNLGIDSNVSTSGNPLRSVDPNLKLPESYQFNIGFEREIARGFVFEANYTVNKTVHLWREYNPNAPLLPAGYSDFTEYLLANPFKFKNANGTTRTYNFVLGSPTDNSSVSCSFTTKNNCSPVNLNSVNTGTGSPAAATADNGNSAGSPVGIALAAIAEFRPDQSVGETERVSSIGNSFYQGLILELRSRYRKLGRGFAATMRAAYTLSSTRDDGLNNTSNAEINSDFSREWARSLQDRRHRFALSGTFDTPRWLGKIKFSPLFRYGSSAPFSLGIGGQDRNLNDVGNDRISFSGNLDDIQTRKPGSAFPTTLAAQFSLQPIGSKSGNLPRNAGSGPSFYTFDLNLSREWKFNKRLKLRPTIEFDNILNASVFSYGSEFIDFNALSATPTATQLANYEKFLVPTRTYRPRQIRLGVRFDF